MTATTLTPTEEQAQAIALAKSGEDMTIRALAGTGKSTTLHMIASELPKKQFKGISFNKAIALENDSESPSNAIWSTAHSLAFRSGLGKKYGKKLRAPRMRIGDVAEALGLSHADGFSIQIEDSEIRISRNEIAYLAKQAVERFCRGGDDDVAEHHIAVPELLWDHSREFRFQTAEVVVPVAKKLWSDITSSTGSLPFSHNNYLKIWQLSRPRIAADSILFDEAQDANGVMLAIVEEQTHAQRVFVGDENQQIYSWNGAVNAMDKTGEGNSCFLTESWRFGQEIADVANEMLSQLDSPAKLIGRGGPSSADAEFGDCNCVLSRTNAGCLSLLIDAVQSGISFHLVGGCDELRNFAWSSHNLQSGKFATHPAISCFKSWREVLEYCETEDDSSDIQMQVKLMESFGPRKVIEMLKGQTEHEENADIVISTAHKSKGRQWGAVAINGDFSETPANEEKRLLYVAVTRAKSGLNFTNVKEHFGGAC